LYGEAEALRATSSRKTISPFLSAAETGRLVAFVISSSDFLASFVMVR
jgi:hypothetical protein